MYPSILSHRCFHIMVNQDLGGVIRSQALVHCDRTYGQSRTWFKEGPVFGMTPTCSGSYLGLSNISIKFPVYTVTFDSILYIVKTMILWSFVLTVGACKFSTFSKALGLSFCCEHLFQKLATNISTPSHTRMEEPIRNKESSGCTEWESRDT